MQGYTFFKNMNFIPQCLSGRCNFSAQIFVYFAKK